MAKLLSPGKQPLPLPSERDVSFQVVSLEVFSAPPRRTASLAGERGAPRLSQSSSQVHQWLGGSGGGGGSGHWKGSLGGLITSSLWHHSLTARCALCHQGLKAEPGSGLHGPSGEPHGGGGQTEGRAAGCCGAAPARGGFACRHHQDFCRQTGLPKWRGGEGCKPKLHH